ncbi:A-kinase anchor protein 9-like, partial [Lingula anatina]|uniref:A-kinase anchor protein 9-like n=1 Tax=Lingula anatina TaxID=7574 RepID=A0A1S3HZ24_LINAN
FCIPFLFHTPVVWHAEVLAVHSDTASPSVGENLPVHQQELLKENARLSQERRDLLKQHGKEKQEYEAHVQQLETAVEEERLRLEDLLEAKKLEIEDLTRQVEAMEKQIKANKQFMESQAVEREQERDDYQREVLKLKEALKEKEKHLTTGQRLKREVQRQT